MPCHQLPGCSQAIFCLRERTFARQSVLPHDSLLTRQAEPVLESTTAPTERLLKGGARVLRPDARFQPGLTSTESADARQSEQGCCIRRQTEANPQPCETFFGALCLPAESNHGPVYPSDRASSWSMLEAGVQVLARAGVASRRAAEEIIASGQVRVNGAVVLVPQHQVAESFDKVRSPANPAVPPRSLACPGKPRFCWAAQRL